MADTTTTNYGLTKPEVGASEDTWGTKINTNLDTLDTTVDSIQGKSGAGVLKHTNNTKLATTSTGIDVTGTATMDGLTVDGDSTLDALELTASSSFPATGFSLNANGFLYGMAGSQGFILRSASNSKALLNISENNDISFYEDTGTTAKLFWDASEEKLGIGTTSSIDQKLTLVDTADVGIKMIKTGSITTTVRAVGGGMAFGVDGGTGTTERMRINSSGDVGIGTSSPSSTLHLKDTRATLRLESESVGGTTFDIRNGVSGGGEGGISFRDITNSANRMVIDSSGNVGIGTSSNFGKLSVNVSAGAPATSGNMTNGLTVHNTDGGRAIQLGVNESGGYTYLQSAYVNSANVAQPMAFFTGANERMRIDSSGTLTTPSGVDFNIMSASGMTLGSTTSITVFKTNNAERMRINSSGSVGINTSSPATVTGGIHVVHNAGEGTPTVIGSEVGIFQRNAVAAQSVSVSLISGTASTSSILFGDKDDIDAGELAWSNSSNSFSFNGGNVNIGVAGKASSTSLAIENASGYAPTLVFNQSGSGAASIAIPASQNALQFNYFNGSLTEAMRIDGYGNLLVGKTAADGGVNGGEIRASGETYLTATSVQPLALNRKSTDGALLNFSKDGTAVGSIASRAGVVMSVVLDPRANGVGLTGTTNTVEPTGPTGTVTNQLCNLGGTSSQFKDLYLSGGVYLGGTGAANKLEDYEEGTWTPTLYGSATAGTATYSQRVGTYTKVGNLAYVQLYVIFSSFTGTSEMRISGLPFTPESGGYENHMGSTQLHQIALPSGTVQVNPRAIDGQTFLALRVTKDNADSTYVTCDAAGEIIISITYRTA
jgi:hypothetical protein